ncbi:hypothetical protein FrEUN1fDRAFT_1884 [Parafrankia sp. EUN1f]|nr:hypothetical protein FrEUN1fDRAFT_1884 [Parafrankia sp. EUN1f]
MPVAAWLPAAVAVPVSVAVPVAVAVSVSVTPMWLRSGGWPDGAATSADGRAAFTNGPEASAADAEGLAGAEGLPETGGVALPGDVRRQPSTQPPQTTP